MTVVGQPTRFTGPKSKRKQNSVPKCTRLIDKTRQGTSSTETYSSTEVYKVNRQDKTHVLVQRSVATSALGRSAAVRERRSLRGAAQRSSGDDHVVLSFQNQRSAREPASTSSQHEASLSPRAERQAKSRRWPSRGPSSRCTVRSGTAACSKSYRTPGTTWSSWSFRVVGRTSHFRRHGTAGGHR